MSDEDGRARLTAPAGRSPVFARTARTSIRSGLLWGAVFGVVVASSAVSYTRIYATSRERNALAEAFGSNHASAALFGPAPDLQHVEGFLVLKSSMTVMILGALWGLLTSTRVLRGEEDAGRWDLLLCGPLTARSATGRALAALGAALAAMWAVTALITVGTGHQHDVGIAVGPSLYFAVALIVSAAMFLGVGAVTSQLAPTRRQAAALAGWTLGVSYLIRMVADAGVGLHGLIWASPLGWAEELQPLTTPDPVAFVPIAGLVAGLAAAAVWLSGRRDAGKSILPDRSHARARLGLLSSPLALSARLVRSTVIAWLCAIAVTGVVLGLIAKQAGATIAGSSLQEVFSRLGVSGLGARAFLGLSFLIVAVLVAFVAAGQTTAARAEEAEGRFGTLAVAPLSRTSWLGGRLLLAVGLLVVAGLVAGAGTWLGGVAERAGVPLPTLLQAGLNVVAPAVCLLGFGFLALGVRPGATSYVVYGVLGWSLLIEVVGGYGSASRWLLDTSLFHHMAAAPTVDPDWATNAVLLALGAVSAAIGVAWFARRDLRGA